MANKLSGQEEAGHFGGSGQVQQIGIVNPRSPTYISYENTSMSTAGVQYHAEIAAEGIKSLDDLQSGFTTQYITNTSIYAKGQAFALGQKYLADHPDGRGYTNFVVTMFTESMKEGIENAPNTEAKIALDNHLKTASLELFESSYNTELRTGAQWQLGQTGETVEKLCNQVLINPSSYISNKALLEQAIVPLQRYSRVLPGGFMVYKKGVLDQYDTAAASGLINVDPYMALRQLGTETHFTGLTSESRKKLLEHTKATIKAREAESRHAEAMEQRRQKLEDTITTQKAMILAANEQLSWNEAANLDYNDPLEKAKLLTELEEQEEKKGAEQKRQSELSTAVQRGEVLVGFTEKEINQSYNEYLAALSGEAVTGQKMQVGLVEEAALALQFKTSKPLDTLTSHLINALEHGVTEDVREAASAIQMLKSENSNLLKEIPKRYIAMADYVSDLLPPSININNSTAFNAKEVERARQTYLHSGRTEAQEKSIDELTERQIKDAFSNNPEKFLRLGIDKDEWNKFVNTGGIEFKRPGWFISDKTVNEYGVPHYLQPKLLEDTERWLREAGRLSPMSSLEEKMKYASNKNREIYGVSKYCDYRVMRYPLEKLYPHLKNTPTLDNMIAMRTYQCVMDNYKVNGHASQVRFIDDDPSTVILTEDFGEFSRNYHKKNYAKSTVPIIEARINGKWEKVRVMARTTDPYKKTVQLFYQIEDGNMMSEVPLTMPSINPYGAGMPLLDEDEE